MEKIGLGTVLDMAGFSSGASAYNKALDGLVGATMSAGNVISSAFSTALGMLSFQAITGAFSSIAGSIKSFATEAMAAERVAANLDAALASSQKRYNRELENYQKAASQMVTVQVAVGKALKPEEVEKYTDQLERARAKMKDMEAAMSSGKPVTESQRVAYKQLQESIAELENKLAGSKLVEKTMSLAQAQGLVAPAMQVTREQIDELARSLSLVTEYDDEAIMGASAIALQFENIGRDVFPDVIKTATDLAARMGVDLSTAAQQLGMALESPGESLNRLRRYGVFFEKQEIEMLKAMTDAGKGAEAQRIILDRLRDSIGGTAEAMGKTASGQIKIFQNTLNNAKEAIGGAFLPLMAQVAGIGTRFLVKAMPGIEAFGSALAEKLGLVGKVIEGVISTYEKTTGGLGAIFTSIQVGLESVFGEGALDKYFIPIADFLNDIYPLGEVLREMFAGSGVNFDWVRELFQTIGLGAPLAEYLADALSRIGNAIAGAREAMQGGDLFAGILAGLETLGLGDLTDKIRTTFDAVREAITVTVSQILPVVQANIGPLIGMFGALGQVRFEGLLVGLRSVAMLVPSIAQLVGAALPVAINLFKQFQVMVAQTGQNILKDFTPVIAKLIQVVAANVPQIGATFSNVMKTIQQAIYTVLPVVTNLATQLVGAFQRILPVILTVINQITQTFGSIIVHIAPVVQYVGTILVNAFVQLAPIIGRVIGEILRIVRDNMPLIAAILRTVADIFAIVLPAAIRLVGKVVETVLPVIRFTFENVLRVILALVQAFLKVLQGDWQGAWETLKEEAQRFAGAITGVFNDLWPRVREIGENIIAGLREGLSSAWKSVERWFKDTVAGLPDWVKKIFGISSPSTVFARIGIDIMLGLAEGLKEGQAAVVNEISAMLGNLTNALSSLLTLARDWGKGSLPILPDLVGWFERAKWSIKAVVDAINIFFDVEQWVSASGLAYATTLAEEINKLFTALVVDWSKFEMPKRMPDVTTFVRAVIHAVSAVVTELGNISDATVENIARTLGIIPAIAEALSILSVSLDVKAPPVNFAQIFDAWLSALAYAGLTLVNNMGRASQALVEAIKKSAEIAPMLKTIMELLTVGLAIKAPPADFARTFDAWLEAFAYVGITLVGRIGRANEALVEAVKKTAELSPLLREIVGIIATSLEIKAPPAGIRDTFDVWLDVFGYIGTTLVTRMGRASAELITQIERVASIVAPIKEIMSVLSVELVEIKLPKDIPSWVNSLDAYLDVLMSAMGRIATAISPEWTREIMEGVAQFGQTVGAVMQGLGAGVEVLGGIGKLAIPGENAINDFLTAVRDRIFEPLYRFAEGMDAEQLTITQTMGSAFGSLLGGLKDAFVVLSGIRDYVDIPGEQMQRFFGDVQDLFMRIYEEAEHLREETLGVTQKVGEVFGALFSGLKAALELFGGVSIYEALNVNRLRAFIADVKTVFSDIYAWVNEAFTPAGDVDPIVLLGRVTEWANAFRGAIELLNSSLEFVHGVTGYGGASEEIGRFVTDFRTMFEQVVGFATAPEVRAAMPLIVEWGNVMRAFFNVLDFVGGVIGELHTLTFPTGLVGRIAEMFTSLGVAINRAIPEVSEAGRSLGAAILNALPTPEAMFDIGVALGTGLANGVSSVIPEVSLFISEGNLNMLSSYLSANTAAMQHIANLILSVQDLRTTIEIHGRIDVPSWMITGTLSDQVKQGEAISTTLTWVTG